jgi:hypothetical protein
MNRLSLCIDIDGTVTEPHYWLRRANQYFSKELKPEDITCYEPYQALGIDPRVYRKFYDAYGPKLHAESQIREGVQEVLNDLFPHHWLHFVTAREERMHDLSVAWLTKHQLPMHSITLLGHPNKAEKAKELMCDFFMEDSLDNAIQLARAGFAVLLVDCTYNQAELPQNITRVRDWYEIKRLIEQHASETQAVKAAN